MFVFGSGVLIGTPQGPSPYVSPFGSSAALNTSPINLGLVQAGELDPTTIDGWVAKTHDIKAELNKETMGEIFIRYKGAEAGEVDWRPTETVPEDYYTL